MEQKDKISARVVILPEFYNDRTKSTINLKEFYGDWYKFDGQELDVSVYSESKLDKEGKIKDITYFYRLPNGTLKLIPKKYCKIIYEFL